MPDSYSVRSGFESLAIHAEPTSPTVPIDLSRGVERQPEEWAILISGSRSAIPPDVNDRDRDHEDHEEHDVAKLCQAATNDGEIAHVIGIVPGGKA
jgi:hypothetical protein